MDYNWNFRMWQSMRGADKDEITYWKKMNVYLITQLRFDKEQ